MEHTDKIFNIVVSIVVIVILSVLIYRIYDPEVSAETVEVEFLEIDEKWSEAIYAYHDEKKFLKIEITDYEKEFDVEFFENLKEVEKVTHKYGGVKYFVIINDEKRKLYDY